MPPLLTFSLLSQHARDPHPQAAGSATKSESEGKMELAHIIDVYFLSTSTRRGPRARNVDLEDLERTAEKGSRGKPGIFPTAGSGASNDGSMALGEALQWAAGALDKIQVRKPTPRRMDQHGC